jgi:26 proteasome complex subunit DSS1
VALAAQRPPLTRRGACAEWTEQAEAPEDATQWEDDWDDDDVSDDFAKQLRAELDKVKPQ